MNEQDKHTFILNDAALREEVRLHSRDSSLENDSTARELNVCHFGFDTLARYFQRHCLVLLYRFTYFYFQT